jgi:hypothetical protein
MEADESTAAVGNDDERNVSAVGKPGKPTKDRVLVPDEFFVYVRPAANSGSSLYRCLKCPPGLTDKTLSCSDVSRQNLYKHIEVSC